VILLNPALTSEQPPSSNLPYALADDAPYLIDCNHPRRQQVESFISQRFLQAHAASITQFMPTLFALFDAHGDVVAALGIRSAADESLFLEHYLDMPVEKAIALNDATSVAAVARSHVVEIGNLASTNQFSSRKLFRILAAHLSARHYQWATFTGTPSLRKVFSLMGINTFSLGSACQSRLPVDQQTWGRYYQHNPSVLAGRVSYGRNLLNNGKPSISEGSLS
jgi:hypothetical protein